MAALLGTTVAALHAPHTRRDALGFGLAAAAAPAAAAASKYPSTTTLADGLSFPLACFGLQFYDDATAEQLTRLAIVSGFRNFHCGINTQNQRGFARGVKASGVPRDELFISGSVLRNRALDADTAYKLTAAECAENLEAFSAGGITTLDMITLDRARKSPWPDEMLRAQWRALEDFKEQGGAKSLAVSNFSPAKLDAILLEKGRRSKPAVNRIDYCVGFHDPGVVAANRRRGILVQAWSPLEQGRLTRFSGDAPEAKQVCAAVGAKYGKSAYQVALRWITQSGASFAVASRSGAHFAEQTVETATFVVAQLVTSSSPGGNHWLQIALHTPEEPLSHRACFLVPTLKPVEIANFEAFNSQAENLALFDWRLDQEDMARLEAINKQPTFAANRKRLERGGS